MLGPDKNRRYYVYGHATDMRKSFNGLCGIVTNELGRNPRCGDVFVFINKRCTLLKLLYWEASGYAIYYKRLESGTFERPVGVGRAIRIGAEDLLLILSGIELHSVVKKKRYCLPAHVE